MIGLTASSLGDVAGWLLFVALLACAIGAMTILMICELLYRVLRRFVKKED